MEENGIEGKRGRRGKEERGGGRKEEEGGKRERVVFRFQTRRKEGVQQTWSYRLS